MKILLKIISLIVLMGIGLFIIYRLFFQQSMVGYQILKPTSTNSTIITNTPFPTNTLIPTSGKNLSEFIFRAIEDADSTSSAYGIVVKNLKTGKEFNLNEHKFYNPASLYKLWVMAAVFDSMQNGTFRESDILSQDIQVLNMEFNIASENAELQGGTVTLSVKEALEKMIIYSDNYAALLLSEKVRLSKIAEFLSENNFNESNLGEPPKATPYDIARFFEKLYRTELVNQLLSQKMINILKKQSINHKIPKFLPENISIAHKTGELGSFSHDAGIVFSDKGDYIIVVMSESDNPQKTEDIIAKISKAVFDYFSE